ncbi:MAG: division/cell wall cluster transcriptional repressor MraZ [Actinomycetota bacterium]
MYHGAYRHTLDAKGRVFLPAKFRAKLAGGVMVAPWFNGYLVIVDKEEWPSFLEELSEARKRGALSATMELVITSEASDEEPDAQGRISIPQIHRDHAKVDKELFFLGRGKRIEVVAAQVWDSKRAAGLAELASVEEPPI